MRWAVTLTRAGLGTLALALALGATLAGAVTSSQVVSHHATAPTVPRPRSERVPRGARLLQIRRSWSHSGRGTTDGLVITLTVTDRAEVDQIARWIDTLPTVQPGRTACPSRPLHPPRVRFVFLSGSGTPLATAAEDADVREPTTACNAMTFTVGGRPQPALLRGAQFLAHVDRLLHLHLAGGGAGLARARG